MRRPACSMALRSWSRAAARSARRNAFAIIVCSFFLAAVNAVGRNLPAVDTSVRPGDDFYKYTNGAWLKATPIPPDRSSTSDGAVLSELADQRTREIIEATASNRDATAD